MGEPRVDARGGRGVERDGREGLELAGAEKGPEEDEGEALRGSGRR